jgi:hypothetical protein
VCMCMHVYEHDVYSLRYISNVGFLSFFIPFNPFIDSDFLKLISCCQRLYVKLCYLCVHVLCKLVAYLCKMLGHCCD